MPDTEPGRVLRETHGFDGEWVTITREEYAAIRYPWFVDKAIADQWHVASTVTDVEGGYMWTAWEKPGDPVVANEMRGCNTDRTHENCPGTHTFMKLIPVGSEEASDG